MTRQEKLNKAREEFQMQENVSSIMDRLESIMKYDTMIYHSADEVHEESWYTVPTEDDYEYPMYKAMQAIIETLEKKFF